MAATGIAVNTKYIKDYKKDFSIYANPAYKRKAFITYDMRESNGMLWTTRILSLIVQRPG